MAFICGFVSLRLWAFVTGGSVHHGDTPLTHDDPGCRPNRSAFTLTGPSQILRCWFGKGTQVSISTELFADVPPSFSFLWTCRRSGVSSPYGGLAPMCLRCCVAMSGPWYTAGANGGATLLGTMVPARLCVFVSIAVVQPTLVTPDGRGGLGG